MTIVKFGYTKPNGSCCTCEYTHEDMNIPNPDCFTNAQLIYSALIWFEKMFKSYSLYLVEVVAR